MNDKNQSFININGRIVPASDAKIPAMQSGLYYGAGCFETFRADQNSIFRFSDHVSRLRKGLTYLGVHGAIQPKTEELRNEISELLEKNNLNNEIARVRLQISLDEKNGYVSDFESGLIKIITCVPAEQGYSTPLRLMTAKTRVVPSICRPSDLKLSNTLHYRAAAREAKAAGFDDALMLNTRGEVAETSIANIFWKKGSKIFTPSAESDILPGIMREAVISIIKEYSGLQLKQGSFHPDELWDSDSVFITNSVRIVQQAATLDEIRFKRDDVFTERLKKGIENQMQNESL